MAMSGKGVYLLTLIFLLHPSTNNLWPGDISIEPRKKTEKAPCTGILLPFLRKRNPLLFSWSTFDSLWGATVSLKWSSQLSSWTRGRNHTISFQKKFLEKRLHLPPKAVKKFFKGETSSSGTLDPSLSTQKQYGGGDLWVKTSQPNFNLPSFPTYFNHGSLSHTPPQPQVSRAPPLGWFNLSPLGNRMVS